MATFPVCAPCACLEPEARRRQQSPRTGHGYEWPCGRWDSDPRAAEERPVLLALSRPSSPSHALSRSESLILVSSPVCTSGSDYELATDPGYNSKYLRLSIHFLYAWTWLCSNLSLVFGKAHIVPVLTAFTPGTTCAATSHLGHILSILIFPDTLSFLCISIWSSIRSQYPLIKQYTDLTFCACSYSVYFWQLRHTCISEDGSLYTAVASVGSLVVQVDTMLETSTNATLVS